ncbi:MAG TPA: pirin family protein [Terriglobales bacterium]|nr:pirin family protein [Terriglobales bacterium]
MIQVRKSQERGHANHGWLDTYHTFSFDTYHDPAFMGFRNLRVINEDRVSGGQGFGMHPHRDMEIITYVLEGALEHRDSMGNRGVIKPGEVQHMSAGTGVRHSEYNASESEPVHLLQIWILPDRQGIKPEYEQQPLDREAARGQFVQVAGPHGDGGALTIHQDAKLYATVLDKGESAQHRFDQGRYGWVQVARGAVNLNGTMLRAGDGAAVANEPEITLTGADGQGEALLFDLA